MRSLMKPASNMGVPTVVYQTKLTLMFDSNVDIVPKCSGLVDAVVEKYLNISSGQHSPTLSLSLKPTFITA